MAGRVFAKFPAAAAPNNLGLTALTLRLHTVVLNFNRADCAGANGLASLNFVGKGFATFRTVHLHALKKNHPCVAGAGAGRAVRRVAGFPAEVVSGLLRF